MALELYRRQGAWKVRAVGQGYAGGLAELLADQGLPEARQLAVGINEAVAQGLARSVAAPPPRTPDADRSRQAAASAPGPDQPYAGPGPQGTSGTVPPQQTPYTTGPQGAAAPQTGRPGSPAQPDPSSVAQPPSPSAGGPVNYSHPGRQTAAPPPPPPTAPPAQPGQPAQPVAGDATGWSMEERLYNQVWGMFEDLARTVAAYRSAVDFADSRMEKELDQVLSDPRSRIGGQGDAAREAARAKHALLVDQARVALDRDLAQLTAEAEVVEPALPTAYASWDNPVWHAYRAPMEVPMALRLGDLSLPETENLSIPMLVRLPLERGLWIDSGRTSLEGTLADSDQVRRLAVDTAVAHAARLLAVYPPGEFTVHVIDPAGTGASSLAPLTQSGVLGSPRPRVPRAWLTYCDVSPSVSTWCRWRCAGSGRLAAAGSRHRRAAADRQRLPARFRRPRRHPAPLPRGRGAGRRRPSDDGGRPGGRGGVRTAARPPVAVAAADHTGARRPSRRSVGRARVDVRALARPREQPGAPAGPGGGGGRPPVLEPLTRSGRLRTLVNLRTARRRAASPSNRKVL